MNITFIGIGQVGSALAGNLLKVGHSVTIAARDLQSDSVQKAQQANPALKALPTQEALRAAEVVFLATPYQANTAVLAGLNLSGKVLVDCTNPVGPGLTHGLQSRTSGAEEVQRLAPGAKVVKAFTLYGFENFQNSAYPGYNVKPMMMFCGQDAGAKKTVAGLIEQLGWEPMDVGGLEQALHLEHMTLLWVRMVRVSGASPHMVWAALKR